MWMAAGKGASRIGAESGQNASCEGVVSSHQVANDHATGTQQGVRPGEQPHLKQRRAPERDKSTRSPYKADPTVRVSVPGAPPAGIPPPTDAWQGGGGTA